jgi:hypothetical protein
MKDQKEVDSDAFKEYYKDINKGEGLRIEGTMVYLPSEVMMGADRSPVSARYG